MTDVHFKNVGPALEAVAPDPIHDDTSCEHDARVAQEEYQQFIFPRT
jgi:hypothetical protein